MRRFTGLTDGFSKKVENHVGAFSLHFMYCNFVRTHQTLRMTPAMAAGVASSPMEIMDIVRIMEERELETIAARKARQVEEGDYYGAAGGRTNRSRAKSGS